MKKKRKKKTKRIIIVLTSILGVVAILCGAFFTYTSIYYHATDHALSYCQDSTLSKVEDKDGYRTFQPKIRIDPVTKNGIIFYPGGKVEYKAYAPLLRDLSDMGITSVLVKRPFNLAVFNSSGAKGKSSLFPDVENWFRAGHSLGGARAADYLSGNASSFSGLILLGAYSTKDLTPYTNLSTLSLLAGNDKILNQDKYAKYKTHLPSLTEKTLKGGIHSYFGDYGLQKKDGVPEVSFDEQETFLVKNISAFVYANRLIS